MELALTRPPLPWTATALLGGLLLLLVAAVVLPLLVPVAGAAAGIGVALALADPWRRFNAAPAHTAFIES